MVGLSAAGIFCSGLSYFIISTPQHFMKAADIRSDPNGDPFWLQDWEFNRMTSLVCVCILLVVFVWSYIVLWRAQRGDLDGQRS